ncbi:zinc transporter SLC39A7-like [Vespula maculifrons]|uniref:Zinc transporter SLC39A7-like n=1 Tax=Vespula maculifrons TaxID=7453 RepID=A0ABD2BZF5_VESMC
MLKIFGSILILCVATTLTYPTVLTKPNEDVMLIRLNRAADFHSTYGHGHGHHHDSRPHGGYHHGHYHDHYHGHHHGHESGHYSGYHSGYAKNDSAKPKRIERSFDDEITDKMEQFDRKNEDESTTNVFWLPSPFIYHKTIYLMFNLSVLQYSRDINNLDLELIYVSNNNELNDESIKIAFCIYLVLDQTMIFTEYYKSVHCSNMDGQENAVNGKAFFNDLQ